MRNIKNISILLSILGMVTFSCQDDPLDITRNDELSSASFWSDESDANAGLTAVYDALESPRGEPGWSALGLFDLLTPIGNSRDRGFRNIAEGTHDPSTNRVNNLWDNMYRGVVRANDFLVNIEDIPFSGDDATEVKNRMIGEARFLRAMYYYMLVEFYGDVPLFTTVPTIEDAAALRAPKAEVLALIKEDITFAVNNLPSPGGEETGRATAGAALALRVKVALHEKDWSTAANAAEEIMGLGYGLVPDYANVINIDNENNEEVIFDVEHVFMNDSEGGGTAEKMYAFRNAAAFGWTVIQPTMWLVDQYERINPTPVEGVDYTNEDPGRIPNAVYEYFEGRDPRMDHTIIRAGSHFVDGTNTDILYPHDFQAVNHSQVGMAMRKYVIPGAGTSGNTDSPLDYIIFRYADILLNYLEAVAMRDGVNTVSQTILDQTINAIRARASSQLPLYTAGNITMDDIYRERICELAMEGWTYFDMKRNGMIEMNNGFEVMGFTVTAGTSIDFNPNKINQTRIFDPAIHYLFPIPGNELERGESLSQNPGYPE
ncbi:RagB/SusD family nutrient uptake outer membrane protein [Fulvivirgaceae bacterium BMA12]|uniref:RagB/SusD family nutrient uptake outer membrane protein n=1 Tax=Agaribacillus aureus TaxID=3051825 RepID=A0ABT8KZ05_9BACT|nr:RagB/SusD family nutrient uptake outer membrane protein [Fulvivirgaceae bacterium BMA12]